jgi:hypothetical protein
MNILVAIYWECNSTCYGGGGGPHSIRILFAFFLESNATCYGERVPPFIVVVLMASDDEFNVKCYGGGGPHSIPQAWVFGKQEKRETQETQANPINESQRITPIKQGF